MYARWIIAGALAAGTGQMTDLLQQDFRGGQFPEEVFAYFSANANLGILARLHVKPDPAGVRITLPARERPIGMVGFSCKPVVPGDFEITIAYELLKSEEPQTGYGMGLALWVAADTGANDVATVARRVVPGTGPVHGTDRAYYTPEGKDTHDAKRFPTADRRGKLRLTRVGGEIIYSAAGDNDAAFRELRREPFPQAPLKAVRVSADTGNGLGELDVVVSDLRIRTGKAGGAPPPAHPAESRDRGWLLAGLVVLVLIVLVGGLILWRTKRRPREKEPT
jgi:hypothetical protein